MTLTLACGPLFHDDGLIISLILMLGIKPLAYFAFIQAFRYRVSRPIPMRFGQAVKLALMRAGLGIALVGAAAAVLAMARNDSLWLMSWGYLYAERLFSWWLVGSLGAGIRGRRLVGWVISGTMINAGFDAALVMGIFDGWLWPTVVIAGIGAFIAALHVVGSRASLKLRFAAGAACRECGYDLTGNLSGRCPECGRAIESAPLAAAA
jgi:hypothetical protein